MFSSTVIRTPGEDDSEPTRNLLIVIQLDTNDHLLLKDATKARKWLETLIIEVYYLLGRLGIWTCRRNILIDLNNIDWDQQSQSRLYESNEVVRALEDLPQVKVIRRSEGGSEGKDRRLTGAVQASLGAPFFANATTICFFISNHPSTPSHNVRETLGPIAGCVDRFERLFLIQALITNTLLSEDSWWRQSLAVEEVHLRPGVLDSGESARMQPPKSEGVASMQGSDGSSSTTATTTPPDLESESKSDPRCEYEDPVPISFQSGTITPRSPSPRLPGGFVRPDDETNTGEPGNISKMSSTESFVTATASPSPDSSEPDVIPVLENVIEGINGHTINAGGTVRLCIDEFTSIHPIRKAFGRYPCLGYHLNGGCIQADCFYLHQEIVFSPRALAAYRQHLANIPCVRGEFCKYHRQGLCFHNHDFTGDLGSVPAVDTPEVIGTAFTPNPKAASFCPGTSSFQVYRAPNRINELASAWAAEPTFRNPDVPYSDPTRPVDFVPLVKALHHLGEKRFGNRVLRSTLGSALKLSPSCPIGSATYPDFRRYVEAAHRAGFVEFGVNKARDAWVRSTGKLERACAES